MLKRSLTTLSVNIFFIVTFAACGGGGGGSIAPETGAITVANAQGVTSSVLNAAVSVIDLIEISNVVDLPGVPGATQRALSSSRLFAKLPSLDGQLQQTCDSGDFTVTWNDADNDTMVSTGDTFDIVFDNCRFALVGITLNGAVSIIDITVVGDPINEIAPWSLMATFVFNNLQGTEDITNETAEIDGDLTLAISSDDNMIVNASISTNSLTVVQSGVTETLSNFTLTEVADLSTLSLTIDASGTFSSTELRNNGSVNFETLSSFEVIGDDNPSAGELLISDDRSSVRVTVSDNISVQLEVDADADGTIDSMIVVPWADLDVGD